MQTDFSYLNEKLGAPTIGIHRADLQAILADHLGREHIHHGMTCVAYNQDEKGANALFAEGDEIRGQILIGADGIKSLVRNQLLGPGTTALRGLHRVARRGADRSTGGAARRDGAGNGSRVAGGDAAHRRRADVLVRDRERAGRR